MGWPELERPVECLTHDLCVVLSQSSSLRRWVVGRARKKTLIMTGAAAGVITSSQDAASASTMASPVVEEAVR
ncbi:hypothetical protein NL676_003192 [Syzygium grande]|nr:hypothetical protein NL676_003192 [Syzygium grande]